MAVLTAVLFVLAGFAALLIAALIGYVIGFDEGWKAMHDEAYGIDPFDSAMKSSGDSKMDYELRNKPKDWIKHLKCKMHGGHDYERYNAFLINAGISKVIEYRCKKCGREKARVI